MIRRIAIAVALACAACGADGVERSVVLDVPPEGTEAYPFDDLIELTVSVTRDGDELARRVIPFGDPIELPAIPFGEDLVIHLAGGNETGEVAYGRTCALEVSEQDDTPLVPHLWFARLVKWGSGAAPEEPARIGGMAWALPDGSAAFAGGVRGEVADPAQITGVERFDPSVTGAFAPITTELIERSGARVAAFADGRAVISGGVVEIGTVVNAVQTLELINPNPGVGEERRYEALDDPLTRLRGHTMTTLVDDRILVAGGELQIGDGAAFEVSGAAVTLEIGEGDTLAPPTPLTLTALTTPRTEHTATRLSDEQGADIVFIGGKDAAGIPVGSVEVFRPLAEKFEALPAAMLRPRWSHVAVRLPGGFILIIGGLEPDALGGPDLPVTEMEIYDPVLGSFTSAGNLSSTAGLIDLTATPLPDGRILIAGGRNEAGTAVATTLIAQLDPANGRVNIIATDALAEPRAGHSAVPLCDGTVLLVGGINGAPAERYNPPAAGRR